MINGSVLFSVIIPLFNKQETIKKTVGSVLNQTFKDFELLIINDGSTDNSLSIVNLIDDVRIRVINKENGGVSSARNLGIKNAQGAYISFLDGDDEWEIDYLETIENMINQHPKINVFATRFAYKLNNEVIKIKDITTGVIPDYFQLALQTAVLNASCVCIKKDVFDLNLPFNENITHGEDIELWTRLAKTYKVAVSSEIKSYYNKGQANQATAKLAKPEASIVNYIDLNNLNNVFERQYKFKIVISRVFAYLKRRKYRYALNVFRKHKKIIPVKHYIFYLWTNTSRLFS